MGLIRIYHKKSPPAKRKPGWRKEAEAYAAWQASIASMTSGIKPKSIVAFKPDRSPPRMLTGTCDGIHPVHTAKYIRGGGTKPVLRPEIQYRDDPEMLARELAARERKHNAAPAYNKGGDQYVTEEELQHLLASNKRRS